MEHVEELVSFLESPRADVRKESAKLVLSLTGSDGGVAMLSAVDKDVPALLCRVLGDDDEAATCAAQALVNMSTNERVRDELCEKKGMWSVLFETVARLAKERDVSVLYQSLVKLLNNLTTTVVGAQRMMAGRLGPDHPGYDLRIVLHSFLIHPEELPEVSMVLTNMTRLDEGRSIVLNRDQSYFRRLAQFVNHPNASLRMSTLETIRNCCFSEDAHKFMMKKSLLVENLMIALLGPGGVAEQDEYEDLPDAVRMAIDKAADEEFPLEMEASESARRAIIDIFTLLCSTRRGREILRNKHVYSVIKVYHGHETNEETNEKVFKLVDFLLGEEEEPLGADSDSDNEVDSERVKEVDMDDIDDGPPKSKSLSLQTTVDPPALPVDKSSALFQVD